MADASLRVSGSLPPAPPVFAAAESPNIVYEFSRDNAREVVRCSLQEYQGRCVVDLRVWMPRSRDGVLVPSPKGVAVDRALLPRLEEAIRAARLALTSSESD